MRTSFTLLGLSLFSVASIACEGAPEEELKTSVGEVRTESLCDGPKTEVTLSDGSTARLPFCAPKVDVLGMLATADSWEVRRALDAHALSPVDHLGRAVVMILSQRYWSSDIGPYNEVIVAAMASERPLSLGVANLSYLLRNPSLEPSEKPVRMVLLKVYVDSEKALRLGNDVWGMGKRLVRIRSNPYDGLVVSGDQGPILGISPTALYPLVSASLPTTPLEFEIETVSRTKGIADYSSGSGFTLPVLPNLFHPLNPFGSYMSYGYSYDDDDAALFEAMDFRPMLLLSIEGSAVGLSKSR